MALEIIGTLIEKGATNQINDRFKKREFVLDITEQGSGSSYPNYAKLQAVQNRCEILDRFNIGDQIKVSFNLRGNKWEKDGRVNYITSLDAWRIEPAVSGQNNAYNNNYENNNTQQAPAASQSNFTSQNNNTAGQEGSDDLPF